MQYVLFGGFATEPALAQAARTGFKGVIFAILENGPLY